MTTALALIVLPSFVHASPIEIRLAEIEAASKGKLGAAVLMATGSHYSRKNERFSLQSVMKMVVAMAALSEVDKGKWKRDMKFTFSRSDLSVNPQPIKDRLGKNKSVRISLADCIELMATRSCNGSADFIIRKLGGTTALNEFLKRHKIQGMSVDRQESELQTNIVGLTWRPEFVDARELESAINKQSRSALDEAYKRYQADPRDTTTPQAMGLLLEKLVTGKLLSPASTTYLLGVMGRTSTGPDRLKAGVPSGWKLMHKTGTSSSHRGVTCATNDVGIARNAAGEWVVIVAMLRNSTLKPDERANVLCQVARAAF
ncbi:MAG: class A beta-lactamase [Fimbriimonadaceae bacterium]